MNQRRIVKVGYAVALWISFNIMFVVQTVHYYDFHEVRYFLYFMGVEIVLMVLTVWISRSRKIGFSVLIALSLLLGFIPYEYGVPFLLNTVSGVIDSCEEFVCEATSIFRLVKSFAFSVAFFLLLFPMIRKSDSKWIKGGGG